MLKVFLGLSLALAALAAPPGDKEQSNSMGKPPEFNAIKWYNTAPITLEDLKGKAVLLQVFRTW
jgi:hypothetical protein